VADCELLLFTGSVVATADRFKNPVLPFETDDRRLSQDFDVRSCGNALDQVAYSALIAPIGLDVYGVSPILVGALAAAEPLGSIVAGVALSAGWLRLNGSRALLRGSLLFLMGLTAMAFSPWFLLAFALLLIGGLGTAAFSNMQTALILTEAPLATRSRVMGIVTMCIGTGPPGVLTIGVLSEQFGPPVAILIMAGLGIGGLSLVWAKLIGVRPSNLVH
jgi:MFS family permease